MFTFFELPWRLVYTSKLFVIVYVESTIWFLLKTVKNGLVLQDSDLIVEPDSCMLGHWSILYSWFRFLYHLCQLEMFRGVSVFDPAASQPSSLKQWSCWCGAEAAKYFIRFISTHKANDCMVSCLTFTFSPLGCCSTFSFFFSHSSFLCFLSIISIQFASWSLIIYLWSCFSFLFLFFFHTLPFVLNSFLLSCGRVSPLLISFPALFCEEWSCWRSWMWIIHQH